MKILLAIPSARYVEPECFASVYEMLKPCAVELFIPNNYSIDVSRNQIAEYAIENGHDYILWVDSDMIIPKDTLIKLLSHNKDIVSGVYAYKILGGKSVVAKRFSKKGHYEDIPIKEIREHKGLMEVDGFGFGCVLTKTEIFKNVKKPYFKFTLQMGEDIYFCRKAQKKYKLYLDTTVLCGHKGNVNYNIKEG